MPEQDIRKLVVQGLQAQKAGTEVAKKATSEIENDAKNPELRSALQAGNRISEEWGRRIDQALAEAGGGGGTMGNQILEAHYEVSRKIRQQASDDLSRDLGIIAAGQLALHYWIAAFGTIRTYAASLGMSRTEQHMQASLDEAKQADEQHTALAKTMLRAK